MDPDLLARAKSRLAELATLLNPLQALEKEYAELSAFVKMAQRVEVFLSPDSGGYTAHAPVAVVKGYRENTAECIIQILNIYGPEMHINDIISRIREAGWQGTGSEQRDYKNVYNVLNLKMGLQKGKRRGSFRLVEKVGIS